MGFILYIVINVLYENILLNNQTPSGVYCPGRKNVKELPKVSSSFFVQQEVVTPGFDITNRKGNITKMIVI
jgi:hypothetical protein